MNYFSLPGLKERPKVRVSNISQDYIVRTVMIYFDTNLDIVKKRTRLRKIVMIRHICFYLLRRNTSMTLHDIGAIFSPGVRDHTTVIHGVKLIDEQLNSKFDNEIKSHIKNIHI